MRRWSVLRKSLEVVGQKRHVRVATCRALGFVRHDKSQCSPRPLIGCVFSYNYCMSSRPAVYGCGMWVSMLMQALPEAI